MITEMDPSRVQPSQAFAENPENFTTRLLPTSGGVFCDYDRLLNVREVAEQLGVSTATVYKICDSGALPHVRIVTSIRVRPVDLAAFVSSRPSKL